MAKPKKPFDASAAPWNFNAPSSKQPVEPAFITLKDTRKLNPITKKVLGSKNNRSVDVNQETLKSIISEAKAAGIDPYTAMAISYQESGFSNGDNLFNLNPQVFGKPFGNAKEGMQSLIEQMKFAKKLQKRKVVPDTEEYLLQGNNGYGRIKRGHADLEGSTSIYGVPIPEQGINFKKNPYYGQTVMSLRDEILKNNKEVDSLVNATPASSTKYSLGGVVDKTSSIMKKRLTGKERLAKYAFGGGVNPDPNKPIIPKTKPTTQDSLALYNSTQAMLNYYRNKKYSETSALPNDKVFDALDRDANEYDSTKKRVVPTKQGKSIDTTLPKSQYRRDVNQNQFFQRERADNILDTRAPMGLYDRRIKPTKGYRFENTESSDPMYGDIVTMYGYDPETIKPAFLKAKKSTTQGTTPTAPILKSKPRPELNPSKVQGIIPNSINIQAKQYSPINIEEAQKTAYSATYRDPNLDSKQRSIYFPDRNAWSSFLNTGALGNIDTSETAQSASATGYKTNKFASGGEAGNGMGFDPYSMGASMLPQLGNALQVLLEKPSYTNQPIMNAQTAKNMTSPYAFGGELDDIDDEQFRLYLQAMFANQMSAEEDDESIDTSTEEIDEDTEDEEDGFAMGGKVKGKKFKKAAKSYYAQGGDTNIEVEGKEIVETPDGQMQKMQGPSHEQGGIDMTVPKGTKIYSDRLELEGKSMQQRKLNREKRLAKAKSMFEKSPTDALARNTFERTQEVVAREDQQDMALQKIAKKIYSAPERKAAYGDEIDGDPTDPWNDYMSATYGFGHQDTSPHFTGDNPAILQGHPLNMTPDNTATPNINIPVTGSTYNNFQNPNYDNAVAANKAANTQYGSATGLTTGDYIGLGANLFNGIAPIINTKNAARATKPEINRFKGFGREALEANAKAQGFAGVNMANAKRDLDTATGSAVLRNRLGARSVNTTRALDTVTDINRNKAVGDIYGQYTNQMTGLLGQQGQLANQRDQMEMSGATARDEREAQNKDNYYSNMAQNLTNLGTNVGNIGRNLNKSQSNKDDASLLAAMSEYFDFGRDKSGKLVLKNKRK